MFGICFFISVLIQISPAKFLRQSMSEAIIDSQKTEKHRLAFLVKKYLLGFFRKVTPNVALERAAHAT